MKRQAMEGGKQEIKLLGQGHYGCVWDSPLLCEDAIKNKTEKDMVGKLAQKVDATNEILASKILSDIKNATDYFVLANVDSYCENIVPLEKQINKKELNRCEPIQKHKSGNVVHYTMPFGGISIIRYVESEISAFPVRKIVTHILEGSALMVLNGFVHYDIHLGNILIDSTDFKARFIDFGFSFSSNNITNDTLDERWKRYDPSYIAEPPEITVITGLRRNYSLKTVVKEVIKGKYLLKDAENKLGLSRYKQLSDFMKFWKTSRVCKNQNWLDFFRIYWPAFDAWGVGFIILYIYSKASYIKDVSPDWPILLTQLKEVLKGLLRMDPKNRLDCVEALHLFSPSSHVVSSSSGKAWLEKKQAVRNEMLEV